MAPGTTIAPLFTRKLLDAAQAAGLDTKALSRAASLDPTALEAMDGRVQLSAHLALWEEAMRALRDPGFPVFTAKQFSVGDYGVVGFAGMARATLGEAFQHLTRHTRLHSRALCFELSRGPETSAIRLQIEGVAPPERGRPTELRLGIRCMHEAALASVVNLGRAFTGTLWRPREVSYSHAAPRDTTAHAAHFGAPVRFGRARTEIVIDPAVLETPLLKADPALAAFFERHIEALRAQQPGDEAIRDRLRAILLEEVRGGLPTLETSASRLRFGARTLRRRLQDEGTTFQRVLDEARRDLALRYVADHRLTLTEVAFLLGFSEQSAFHRAFKRWTGVTPLAHRQRAAGVI